MNQEAQTLLAAVRQIAMLEDALRLQRNEAQALRLANVGLVQHAQYLADEANALRAELREVKSDKLLTLTDLHTARCAVEELEGENAELYADLDRSRMRAEATVEMFGDRLQDTDLALDRACKERDRALADLAAALGGLVNAADLKF